ncbi:MAG TPA: vanadium-dependent haloperoxidase [Cyclobacteriaceae bacterium]|nr:vanadium-dependent haloperoxidase [Cyclobacteriaceae bacterium]
MKTYSKILVALIVAAATSACGPDAEIGAGEKGEGNAYFKKSYYDALVKSYKPEIVLKWNQAVGLAIENKMPTIAEARIYAMTMLSMHDALNNVIPKYEPYAILNAAINRKDLSKKNISQIADAAVSQAAHDALVNLFPAAQGDADDLLALCLSEIEDSEFKTRGITIGMDAASAVLAKRQSDAPIGFISYMMGTEPGIHQANYLPYAIANPPVWPANAAYGANVGSYVPFGIAATDQFRPGPPFVVSSAAYTADFNEVKKLGCTTCTERTAEQTEIGSFWKVNTSGPMNTIARNLAMQEKLNGWETARLLALNQMAQIDANIASFEGKYHYNFWLPITAIRAGDTDGNDDTQGDVNWTPTAIPPPTPDYPSTPATAGGASAEVFRQFFRTDNKSFIVTSPNSLPGVERSYTSFSAVSKENAVSRIYLGSHFRNSCLEGEKQGQEIGKYVFENNLREIAYPF